MKMKKRYRVYSWKDVEAEGYKEAEFKGTGPNAMNVMTLELANTKPDEPKAVVGGSPILEEVFMFLILCPLPKGVIEKMVEEIAKRKYVKVIPFDSME